MRAKNFNRADLLLLYETLLLPRTIEERMLTLLRQNRISKWFSGIGQEAISVGTVMAAERGDYLLPMHRNLGIFTTRKVPFYPLFCQLFGKADGFTNGRDRSFHFGLLQYNIVGMISHLAATMPLADGLALACKLKGEARVAISFCGDGATSEGDFHEALNLAGVWKLPVVFIIENNGYGLSTPVSRQFACKQLVDRAAGYGLEGIRVDGNDLFAVMDAVSRARRMALEGKPVLLEAMTFRMRGHEEASGTFYVPDELFEKWKQRDPVKHLEDHLLETGTVESRDKLQSISDKVKASFEPDLKKALEAPEPQFDKIKELADAGLVRPAPHKTRENVSGNANKTEKRFLDSIQQALFQAFSEDDSFILMGQDIAEYGGVFKVTQGMLEQFGKERIRDTPIIESGAVGTAIGLALEGFKPVVEMQFADFISCAFNQIVNHLAKGRYRWMPQLNITIRSPHGAGVAAGPFHSQSPEGWFMAQPGLRILVPGSVEDAANMLYSALFDPNPVLFFEHKRLYRTLKQQTRDTCTFTDLGKAAVRRNGSDLSIITYGMGLQWADKAAGEYEKRGVSIEVVDLRSLAPVDWDTLRSSVRKTGKVLLLQEASHTMGPMSEIAATLSETCFDLLDAPPERCSSLDTPVPFHPVLEKGYLAENRLAKVLEELLEF